MDVGMGEGWVRVLYVYVLCLVSFFLFEGYVYGLRV